MGNVSSVRKSFKYGFVLNEQELRRIYDIMTTQMKEIDPGENYQKTFDITYKNSVSEKKTTIEDIFNEDNGQKWEIEKIEIEFDSSYKNRINILFDSKNASYHISINIKGENRNWVYLTLSKLEERISFIKRFALLTNPWTMLSPIVKTKID